jgi:hypothetical protein
VCGGGLLIIQSQGLIFRSYLSIPCGHFSPLPGYWNILEKGKLDNQILKRLSCTKTQCIVKLYRAPDISGNGKWPVNWQKYWSYIFVLLQTCSISTVLYSKKKMPQGFRHENLTVVNDSHSAHRSRTEERARGKACGSQLPGPLPVKITEPRTRGRGVWRVRKVNKGKGTERRVVCVPAAWGCKTRPEAWYVWCCGVISASGAAKWSWHPECPTCQVKRLFKEDYLKRTRKS